MRQPSQPNLSRTSQDLLLLAEKSQSETTESTQPLSDKSRLATSREVSLSNQRRKDRRNRNRHGFPLISRARAHKALRALQSNPPDLPPPGKPSRLQHSSTSCQACMCIKRLSVYVGVGPTPDPTAPCGSGVRRETSSIKNLKSLLR